jgi:tetratricopeptide (TPR) repeat protein
MFKFCPECGLKLEKEFKFCPECGVNLEGASQQDFVKEELVNSITCENCGEENNPDNEICAGCGIRLKNKAEVKNPVKKIQPSGKQKASYKKAKDKRQNKKAHNQQEQPAVKSLNKKNLIIILGVLLVGIFIILETSDILDAKKVTDNIPQVNESQPSGVDLNNIQKINELEARVKADPTNKDLILQLAHLKNDSRMYQQAIVDYKKYLTMQPGNADARVDMGVCYYNLGDFKTAISEMETALKYNPHHQIAFLNLGIVNLSAGNFKESQDWLEKAVKENPDNDIGKRAKELLDSHAKQK